MMKPPKSLFRWLLVSLVALAAFPAAADEASDLVEQDAVRNRLFHVDGRWEVGADVGLTLVSRLTEHYNFTASVAYNLMESFAVELRGGYALSRHTGLAQRIADQFYKEQNAGGMGPKNTVFNDLSDSFEIKANFLLGARWQPIYGKVSLLAELPVHFQLYLWAGVGGALLSKESILVCNGAGTKVDPATGATVAACATPYTENKFGPLASVAIGFRFFVTERNSFKIELRDYAFFDSYLTDVKYAQAFTSPTGGGTPATVAGVTNLIMFDLGYAFVF